LLRMVGMQFVSFRTGDIASLDARFLHLCQSDFPLRHGLQFCTVPGVL
jgi:hypothetical protein